MGTLTKTKAGTYKAIVRKSGTFKTKTFPTKKSATKWMREYEASLAGTTPEAVAEISAAGCPAKPLPEVFQEYLAHVQGRLRSPRTEASYAAVLSSLLVDVDNQPYTLWTLTPPILDSFRDKVLKTRAPSTVRKYLLFISRVYSYATKVLHQDVVNPIPLINVPSGNRSRTRVISEGELSRILDNVSDSMRPAIQFMYVTAMRRGEVTKLQWEWVDLGNKQIHLPTDKGGAIRGTDEGRSVPLSSSAIKILESISHREGSVFNVSPYGVTTAFTRARDRLGLEDVVLHDTRRSCITKYAANGLSAPVLQKISGHRTLSILQRYINLDAKRVADLMD